MGKYLILLFIFMINCTHLTNDEAIIEINKCLKNNLDYHIGYATNSNEGRIMYVTCQKKKVYLATDTK